MITDIAIWIMYFVSIYFAMFWLLVILEQGIKDPQKQPLKKTPTVTVAIPAHNEEDTLLGTLQSVLNLNYPRKKLEVIIINDASTDSTQRVITSFLATYTGTTRIHLINNRVNIGKGASLNKALSNATGEYFVCLDADSFIEPEALTTMLPHFDDPRVGSVLPLMKLKKTRGSILKLQWVEYMVNFFLKKVMSLLDCVHVTPGPFAAYKKNVLKHIGGFDTNNLTEDLEMALRLQEHHYKIIQLLHPVVYTLAPTTLKGWFKQRNRWYKGTLLNLYKYKHLLGNTRYGDFGFFQLPMILASACLSIFFAIFIVWQHGIYPFIQKMNDMSYINFDIGLMSKLWMERFTFLDLNFMLLFFTTLVFTFGITWILCGHKYHNEHFLRKGIYPTTLFILAYPFLLSTVWLSVVFDLVRGKKQKW